jgi:hypothetical protein
LIIGATKGGITMVHVDSCRVQWVTRASQMAGVVERLTACGGNLIARSGYDLATADLDVIEDGETGHLSIAEFTVDPAELTRQVVAASNRLGTGETLLIDLTGARPKVQVLPVPGKHGVIVRRYDGLRRFPRSTNGFGRHNTRWLAHQLAQGGHA